MNKKTIISSILGIIVIIYLINISDIEPDTIYSIINPDAIMISISVSILAFFVNALRMKELLKTISDKNIALTELTKVEFTSKFVYYLTPSKIYIPFKALIMNRMFGIKKSTMAAITAFEYGLDVSLMLILSLIGFAFFNNMALGIDTRKTTLIFIAIILATIIFLKAPIAKIIEKIKNHKISSNQRIGKIIEYISRLLTASQDTWKQILTNKKMINIIPITFISLFINAFVMEELYRSYGIDVPLIPVFFICIISTTIGGLSQIPGGLGVRESISVILYNSIGIPQEYTIMVLIIARLMSIIPIAIGYYYSTRLYGDKIESIID